MKSDKTVEYGWVEIHYKENSIPSIRGGFLTNETRKAINANNLKTALEIIEGLPKLAFSRSVSEGLGKNYISEDELRTAFTKYYEGEME